MCIRMYFSIYAAKVVNSPKGCNTTNIVRAQIPELDTLLLLRDQWHSLALTDCMRVSYLYHGQDQWHFPMDRKALLYNDNYTLYLFFFAAASLLFF